MRLSQTADVPLSSAEFASEKSLNEIPSHGRANSPTAHADHVHIVIFNPLLGRVMIVNESRAHAKHLIRASRGTHAAAADWRTSPVATARASGKIMSGIIICGIKLVGSKIDDLMTCRLQLIKQFFF